MRWNFRSLTLVGLLAAGAWLLAEATPAQAQIGGSGITIGRPGGFNVSAGSGTPGYGYGGYGPAYGYSGYASGYQPGYYGYRNAPGTVVYGRGYTSYTQPGWNGYPGYSTTSYRIAPGVTYNTYGYSYPSQGYYGYRYGNYRAPTYAYPTYAPRVYYRR